MGILATAVAGYLGRKKMPDLRLMTKKMPGLRSTTKGQRKKRKAAKAAKEGH